MRINYSNDTVSRLDFKKKIKVEIEPKFYLSDIYLDISTVSIYKYICFLKPLFFVRGVAAAAALEVPYRPHNL